MLAPDPDVAVLEAGIRLWKVAVQGLADATGLRVKVCHFPPGTSKWNKIEHRMFCRITENWRGRPLWSLGVIVSLIGNTRTEAGLRIKAELDLNPCEVGIKVTDEQLAAVSIERDAFHGDWNYTISPKGEPAIRRKGGRARSTAAGRGRQPP